MKPPVSVRWLAAVILACSAGTPAHAEWTVGAFLGGARTQTTSMRVTQPSDLTDVTLEPIRFRSESLTPPLYYVYRVALFPRSGRVGFEAELIHLKAVADTGATTSFNGVVRGEPVMHSGRVASLIGRFSMTHGVNLLLANVVFRPAVDSNELPRWLPTGRLGVGASIPHAESTIGGRVSEGYEWGALGLQAAVGLEVRLIRRLYAAAEYKLTRTAPSVSVDGGSAKTSLTSHHAVTGLVVRLGTTSRTQN